MSTETQPAVSEAMRETVARLPEATYDDLVRACRQTELDNRRLTSEIARLTVRAEIANAKAENADLIAKNEWLRSEGLLERARAAEAALSRLQADRDAEVGKLRAALLLARQAVANHVESHRPWVEKIADRVNPWQATLNAVDAALTETPDA